MFNRVVRRAQHHGVARRTRAGLTGVLVAANVIAIGFAPHAVSAAGTADVQGPIASPARNVGGAVSWPRRVPDVVASTPAGPGTDVAQSFVVPAAGAPGNSADARARAGRQTVPSLLDGGEVVIGGLPVHVSLGNGDVFRGQGRSLGAEVVAEGRSNSAAPGGVDLVVAADGAQRAPGLLSPFVAERRVDAATAARSSGGVVVRLDFDVSGLVGAESIDFLHRLRFASVADCTAQLTDVTASGGCAPVELPSTFDPETMTLTTELVVSETSTDFVVEPTPPAGAESDVPLDPNLPVPPADTGVDTTAPTVDAGASTDSSVRGFSGSPDGVAGRISAGQHALAMVLGGSRFLRAASGGGSTYYGLTAGYTSEFGSFAATPLAAASSWSVGLQAGSFDWSYPIPMIETGWGMTPSVSVDYSSSSVDGVSSDENTQSTDLGVGWNVSGGGYIERAYRPCRADTQGGWAIADLCWFTDAAGNYGFYTLVLNGRASTMVQIGPSEWRLEDDPNWRIVQKFGAAGSPDDNGEYFEVTTPDGTVYSFGAQPGLGSVWEVPVFANGSNEPCYNANASLSWCTQAWRWNLDTVIDVNGNRAEYSYSREQNKYARFGTPSLATTYTRGGHLQQIRYGYNPAAGQATPSARVIFTLKDRCSATPAGACAWSLPGSTATPNWLDVPTNFNCALTATSCDDFAPAFYTNQVLTGVTTGFYNGSTYTLVDSVSLVTEWPDLADPTPAQLFLREIRRTGYTGGAAVAVPAIRFESFRSYFDNRADNVTVSIWRVDTVIDELGGSINVTYGQPNGCTGQPAAGWDENTQDCYPKWTVLGSSSGYGWFNKFKVMNVEHKDETAYSPSVFTYYEYLDAPAWHHNDDPASNPTYRVFFDCNQNGVTTWETCDITTWSDYRGHGQVRVTVGNGASGAQTVTEYRFFRGMNNDDRDGADPNKVVSVSDTKGTAFSDDNWLRGREFESSVLYSVTPRRAATATYTDYVIQPHPLNGNARRVLPGTVWTYVWSTGGIQQTSRVTTQYNADGFPSQVSDFGDTATPLDDRCSVYTYAANNTTVWLLGFVGEVEVRDCSSTPLSRSRMFYDGAVSHTAAPTKGNVTRSEDFTNATTALATTYTYNTAGQVRIVDGPRTDVKDTATTTYGTAFGFPLTVTNAMGHVTTNSYDYALARSEPRTVTDANGKVTTFLYEGLGRLWKVWTADELTTGTPAVEFTYTMSKTAGWNVKTSATQNAATALNSWVYYDGLGNPVQQQQPSPGAAGGRIVDLAGYNERGLVTRSISARFDSAAPGSSRVALPTASVDRETRAVYDQLGRPTANQTWSAIGLRWQTTIAYDRFVTTVTPPVGQPTATTVSPRGATLSVRRYVTATTWATTTYTVDRLDRVVTVAPPVGTTTTTAYDWMGRVTMVTDPNAGITTTVYGDNVNPTSVATPIGTTWTKYDALARPTERRLTNATGNLLGKWVYDNVLVTPTEKGLLDYSESWDGAGLRIMRTDAPAYDARNRPTGVTYTVDSRAGWTDGATPLAGTYTFSFGYDKADHRTTLGYPAAGGLGAETVTTAYNSAGRAITLTGDYRYVKNTTFENYGPVATRQINDVAGTSILTRTYGWDASTGRLNSLTATNQYGAATTTVQQLAFTYDNGGNLTSNTDSVAGQRQCFGYDHWNRLTTNYTTTNLAACAGAVTGGPAPYNATFSYDNADRLTVGPAGSSYQYNLPSRPDAVSAVVTTGGTDAYTYDGAGNRTSFTDADGPDYTYTWDTLGRLLAATSGTSVTSHLYDTDRQLVLRKDPNGTVTLFLGGFLEIKRTTTGTPRASRFYSIDGVSIGVRDPAVNEWFLGDERGSIHTTVDYFSGAIKRVHYKPYGDTRSTVGAPATEHRFLNQTDEPSTGLVYLNNRFYDPQLGSFVSVDPLVVQTGEPYIYASANPTTLADPSGLCTEGQNGCGIDGGGKPGLKQPRTYGPPAPPPHRTVPTQPNRSTNDCSVGCLTGGTGDHPTPTDWRFAGVEYNVTFDGPASIDLPEGCPAFCDVIVMLTFTGGDLISGGYVYADNFEPNESAFGATLLESGDTRAYFFGRSSGLPLPRASSIDIEPSIAGTPVSSGDGGGGSWTALVIVNDLNPARGWTGPLAPDRITYDMLTVSEGNQMLLVNGELYFEGTDWLP